MRLIEGKFYEGDRVIPLEFGNKEQIKLINEAKRTMDELTGDGMVVDPDMETILTEYPQKFDTIDKAVRFAWENSTKVDFSDFFHYIFRSTSGGFIVDIIAEVYSDEELIETYYKGLKQ